MVGVPTWLTRTKVLPIEKPQRARTAFGYSFTSDVELIDGSLHYMIELKRGMKYEPLAMAEVLHHSAWVKRYECAPDRRVVPVIISSFNAWLRLSIDEYLRDAVRYHEVEILDD